MFECERYNNTDGFNHYLLVKPEKQKMCLINEKIQEVIVVRDEIIFTKDDCNITVDQALVIKTDKIYYVFWRAEIFDEIIIIKTDKGDYKDCIPSVEKERKEWKDNYDGDTDVILTRKEIIL